MPRARRSQRPRNADATRELLLEAATAVFAEHGFAGARVDEVARRAGVNKALIYAYYGDKGGLYRAVLSSRFPAPGSLAPAAADTDAGQMLLELIRRYFRLLMEDRAFARLLAWDLLSGGRGGRDVLNESARPGLDLVVDLVRRARATGALRRSVDPELFRTALVSLAIGYSLQHSAMQADRQRTGARFTDEEFVDYACRLLLESDGGGAGSTRSRTR